MRPLRVVMQAFGPYGQREVLDFAELGARRFFLVCGPTGAGKTTVLDAMAFALYGATSGAERDPRDMRSQHARSDLLTEVEFDFSVGDAAYRILRLPQQERPKKVGEGTTTQNQDATLWALDGDEPRPLAHGWAAVTARVTDLLGFRDEQFRQVVMLPQGRFQELLTAKTPERERILATLFATSFYGSIERALREAAGDVREQRQINDVRRADRLRDAGVSTHDELDDVAQAAATAATDVHEAATAASEADARAQAALEAARVSRATLHAAATAASELAVLEGRLGEIDAARAELAAAEGAAALADAVADADARRGELEKARVDATRLDAQAAAAENVCRARLAELEAEQARAPARESAAAAVRGLEALVAQTRGLGELQSRRDVALAAATTKRHAADAAAAAWRDSAERLAALEHLWTTGRAGALSASLAPGEPCPVCGSTHHPAPALPVEGAPHDEALDRVRHEAAALLAGKDELAATAAKADAAVAGLQAELTARLSGLPDGVTDEAEIVALLDEGTAERDALAAALAQATQAARSAETGLAIARAAAAAAGEAATHCSERCAEAEGRLSERLLDAGFADETAWRSAAREAVRLVELRTALETFTADLAAARDRAARASAAAAGLATPEMGAIELAARTAHDELLEATRREQEAASAAASLQQSLKTLRGLDQEAAQLDERYGVVGTIADVVNGRGRNTLNLRFQSFVLGAFLDRVLEVASQRLGIMTEGRYDLQRTESARRGRAAGLDLEVADAWTGETRPVSTLSGGETFMAALSLALGLAEVVQEYSGGVRLDTVFIDEGFGSLDEEALELAIDALVTLQEGGRLVGIISHVAELRERVDARLEVAAGKTGSSVAFVVS
jgi:exonuclease SbcC